MADARLSWRVAGAALKQIDGAAELLALRNKRGGNRFA
jgi:hypothetical protein